MVRFQDTKRYKLGSKFGEPEEWTDEEKAIASVMEMSMDVALAMATGTISTWVQLARTYDSNKAWDEQSPEFQRQLAVTAASSIGMGIVLHSAGMTSFEFAVGRTVALRPVTSVLYNPIVVAPVAMAVMAKKYPEIAGPQYQSAMTGQPTIGGAALDKAPASSWSQFFSLDYWGF
jgi:hypothetical protein